MRLRQALLFMRLRQALLSDKLYFFYKLTKNNFLTIIFYLKANDCNDEPWNKHKVRISRSSSVAL